jgi:hypothetical protein
MTSSANHLCPAPDLRQCRQCDQHKVLGEFRPAKVTKTGRRYERFVCRGCENASWRAAWRAGKRGRQNATTLALNAPHIPAAMLTSGTRSKALLEDMIRARMDLYQCSALDALHDLAMMPISESSAQNRIKLAAAVELAGDLTENGTKVSDRLARCIAQVNER